MMIKNFLASVLFILCFVSSYGQQNEFCDAVTTIMRDAPNGFKNIRGKVENSNMNAIAWECGIKVPGTIASRFLTSMGHFYEGAFFQTANVAEMKPVYDKYKKMLEDCLAPLGYSTILGDNFYQDLGQYKKVILMQAHNDTMKINTAPPHVALEALYNKDQKKYSLVMYIYEH